jgi:hypothetical protein
MQYADMRRTKGYAAERAPTNSDGDLSITDISWKVNRQIFKYRYLLTNGGGPTRAVLLNARGGSP